MSGSAFFGESYADRVLDHRRLTGARRVDVDVVVVGTGAGGATAAHELAAAGLKVAALEAGSYHPLTSLDQDLAGTVRKIYWNQSNLGPSDGSLRITQGRAVGGSTLIHMLTMDRIPDATLARWHGLGLASFEKHEIDAIFAFLSERMNIRQVPWELVNANARTFVRGCDALGVKWRLNERNAGACIGSGRCHLGCPFGGKVSMDVSFVPRALDLGLSLYTDTWVDKVDVTRGAAVGLTARVRDPDTRAVVGTLDVRAKAVVLAAGALQTPAILLRSSLQTPGGLVGRRLHVQPGVTIVGEFDERIDGWQGITNPVHIDAWIEPSQGGFFCEPGLLNASIVASALPGFGEDHARLMARLPHFAGGEVLLADSGENDEGDGRQRITLDHAGEPEVNYRLTRADQARMRTALRRLSEVLLAAGARRVFLSHRYPVTIASRADLGLIDELPLGPNDVVLNSVHPQGTCPTGASVRTGVVRETGELFGCKNLFVADASAFPDGIGTNTTIAAATFGVRCGRHIARSWS